MPELHLRTATPDDAAAVRDLTRRAYQPWVPIVGREPKPMTADYDEALRRHRIDLHEEAGGLAALIEMALEDDHLLIVNIAVDPPRQGQGLGRRLLAHAEAVAAQAGLAELRLYTNARMTRNIALYQAAGYQIDRSEGAAVHMSRRLAHPRLLFLPGAGASPEFWKPMAALLPADWPRRHFGWPGLGDEPPHPDVNGLDDLVRLVEAELTQTPSDLIAQSMGGVVALKVALRNPGRVRRLVLAVTSGGVDAAARAAALHDWRIGYRAAHPRAAAWIAEDRTDLTAELPGLPCPTLLLFGDADPIAPPFVAERLAELLPNARLHIVEGGGHDLVVTHAPRLAPLLANHLA